MAQKFTYITRAGYNVILDAKNNNTESYKPGAVISYFIPVYDYRIDNYAHVNDFDTYKNDLINHLLDPANGGLLATSDAFLWNHDNTNTNMYEVATKGDGDVPVGYFVGDSSTTINGTALEGYLHSASIGVNKYNQSGVKKFLNEYIYGYEGDITVSPTELIATEGWAEYSTSESDWFNTLTNGFFIDNVSWKIANANKGKLFNTVTYTSKKILTETESIASLLVDFSQKIGSIRYNKVITFVQGVDESGNFSELTPLTITVFPDTQLKTNFEDGGINNLKLDIQMRFRLNEQPEFDDTVIEDGDNWISLNTAVDNRDQGTHTQWRHNSVIISSDYDNSINAPGRLVISNRAEIDGELTGSGNQIVLQNIQYNNGVPISREWKFNFTGRYSPGPGTYLPLPTLELNAPYEGCTLISKGTYLGDGNNYLGGVYTNLLAGDSDSLNTIELVSHIIPIISNSNNLGSALKSFNSVFVNSVSSGNFVDLNISTESTNRVINIMRDVLFLNNTKLGTSSVNGINQLWFDDSDSATVKSTGKTDFQFAGGSFIINRLQSETTVTRDITISNTDNDNHFIKLERYSVGYGRRVEIFHDSIAFYYRIGTSNPIYTHGSLTPNSTGFDIDSDRLLRLKGTGITINSSLTPDVNNTLDIGSSSNRFKDIWTDNLKNSTSIKCHVNFVPEVDNVRSLGQTNLRWADVNTLKVDSSGSDLTLDAGVSGNLKDVIMGENVARIKLSSGQTELGAAFSMPFDSTIGYPIYKTHSRYIYSRQLLPQTEFSSSIPLSIGLEDNKWRKSYVEQMYGFHIPDKFLIKIRLGSGVSSTNPTGDPVECHVWKVGKTVFISPQYSITLDNAGSSNVNFFNPADNGVLTLTEIANMNISTQSNYSSVFITNYVNPGNPNSHLKCNTILERTDASIDYFTLNMMGPVSVPPSSTTPYEILFKLFWSHPTRGNVLIRPFQIITYQSQNTEPIVGLPAVIDV